MSDVVFHLSSRWRSRAEDAAACGARLAAMLGALAPLHPAFSRWCRKAMTRAAANRPFCTMPPRADELARILTRLSPPGPLGCDFGVYAWNGLDPPYALSFHASVGLEGNIPYFPNSVTLSLPLQTLTNRDLLCFDVMKPAVLAVVAAWEPDFVDLQPWAYWERWERWEPWDEDDRKAQSLDHRAPRVAGVNSITEPAAYLPRVQAGWISYLCPDYARRITVPAAIEAEPVAGGGLLLIATRDQFTPGNPAHDAAADIMQDALLPLQDLP